MDSLTDRQREVLASIRPGEAMAWLVIHRDGWTSGVKLDRARAEQYAGQQHGVLLPLVVAQTALEECAGIFSQDVAVGAVLRR